MPLGKSPILHLPTPSLCFTKVYMAYKCNTIGLQLQLIENLFLTTLWIIFSFMGVVKPLIHHIPIHLVPLWKLVNLNGSVAGAIWGCMTLPIKTTSTAAIPQIQRVCMTWPLKPHNSVQHCYMHRHICNESTWHLTWWIRFRCSGVAICPVSLGNSPSWPWKQLSTEVAFVLDGLYLGERSP